MSHTVLIVEDEQKLSDLLHDYLRQAGFDSVSVGDGNQVLAAVKQYQPDLILLDIMLPNKDGITLCRELRQSALWQHTPIINDHGASG